MIQIIIFLYFIYINVFKIIKFIDKNQSELNYFNILNNKKCNLKLIDSNEFNNESINVLSIYPSGTIISVYMLN